MTTFDIKNLTSEQAHTIIRALDLYVAVSIWDVDMVVSVIMSLHYDKLRDKIRMSELKESVDRIFRPLIGPEFGVSLGMGHRGQHKDGLIAHDIEQALRHKVAEIEKPHINSTWNKQPVQRSLIPLPIITTND